MSDELASALESLFVVALVAALAPFIVGLVPRLRVPQVVVLIVGGIIVGPQVMHLAEPKSIELLSNVGLGFIFLLAGYELELALFRQRPGKLAIVAWVASAVIVYRSALPRPQRFELVLLLATALPLLVALSEIGLQSGIMLPQNAAALVGAGVLSVLVFRQSPLASTGVLPHLPTQSLVLGSDAARTTEG